MQTKSIIKFLFLISFLTFLLTKFIKEDLPSLDAIIPEIINNSPIQKEVEIPPFDINIKEYKYTLSPKYSYELYGLVVTEYDSDNWLDYTHKDDPGNIKDICVVWGENIKNGSYKDVKFRSGQFTCFFEWNSNLKASFDIYKVSNNHMIYASQQVFEKIRYARRGDQIHFKGMLVNYEVKNSKGNTVYYRNTSTTRNDTGNGACEIVYATEFEILKQGDRSLKLINEISLYIMILIFAISAISFLKNPFKTNNQL